MNGIIRSAMRVKSVVSPTISLARAQKNPSRLIWSMCVRSDDKVSLNSLLKNCYTCRNTTCTCGCRRLASTKAERDLVEFLSEEIVAEKQAHKMKTLPTEIKGFKVSLDGSKVTLVKNVNDETITIFFNINHTVNTEAEPQIDPNDEKPDIGEMKSKPNFEIHVKKGKQTLAFNCSFNEQPGASGADDEYNDIFGVDEISIFEGELTENTYSVGGEIIDGYLYDLLMNYLEEKGISNEFAEEIVNFSTTYEHSAYISLLEGLSKFTSK